MSNTLPSALIASLLSGFRNNKPLSTPLSARLSAIFIGSTISASAIYTFGTTEEKNIEIKEKYKFNRNGFTKFMIVDKNDKHYCVNNSTWYCKFDSIEDYNKIKIGSVQYIKYYGYRIPIFNMFPNIVKSKETYKYC